MIDLLAYATGTRWFGSQPARLLDTSVSRWWVAPRGRDHVGVRSAFLDVSFGAEPLRFHIPLGYVAPGTSESTALAQESIDGLEYDVVDATDDHRCRLALFQALADGGDGFEVVRAFSPEGLATRRFGGEQSNTTIVLGDAVMMKVFRRVATGPNPDIECHRALAGSGTVAALYGRWHHDDQDLALAVELLAEPVDGYVTALDAASAGRDFRDDAAALGTTLARVHRSLAETLGTSTLDGAWLSTHLKLRLDEAIAEAPELASFRTTFEEQYEAISSISLPAQRIHGDCHLGQAISSRGSWYFVDFEGEPLVPLEQRRRPDLAVRDVAGMLRSFGYAAASGSATWLADCRAAFLEGYGPLSTGENQVLRALEIDKACYEVRYERRYRPHLLDVPMSFLKNLATTL